MDASIHGPRGRRSRKSWRRATAIGSAVLLAATAAGVAGAQSGADGDGNSVAAAAVSAAQAEVFVGLSPVRVLDTRPAPYATIGVPAAGKVGPNSQLDLSLVGPGRPLPAGATSAVVNVTIDQDATSKGFLTIWPKGEPRPNASANNAEPGFVAANSMIAKLGADDAVSVYNSQGETHIIIDVVGYLVPADQVTGLGSQFLVAAGPPAGGTGGDGDMYYDTATRDLYGPKSAGGWASPVANLGGTAETSSSTPVDGDPCPSSGQVNFNTANGEISICVGGVWEGPVQVRSTIDAATTYQESSLPVALTTTFADVATFTASAAGAYTLDSSVTLSQTGTEPVATLTNLACRWVAGGALAGPAVSESFTAQTVLGGTPNTVFLAPKASAALDTGDNATLQCALDPGFTGLGTYQVENWAFTATRTPLVP